MRMTASSSQLCTGNRQTGRGLEQQTLRSEVQMTASPRSRRGSQPVDTFKPSAVVPWTHSPPVARKAPR
jgi:hypothetical protein